MQVLVVTDNYVDGKERFRGYVESEIARILDRFKTRLTRVEVHFHDDNSDQKGGLDKRCAIEAHVNGLTPLNATHQASSVDVALHGAAGKFKTGHPACDRQTP